MVTELEFKDRFYMAPDGVDGKVLWFEPSTGPFQYGWTRDQALQILQLIQDNFVNEDD